MSSNSNGSSVFADALNLTMSELVFPDANELFERRIRMLEKFTSAALPESLVSKTTDAINLTRYAQSSCGLFVTSARTIAELPTDSVILFLLAALALENEAVTATVDDKAKEMLSLARNTFLSAVVGKLKSGKLDGTFKDVLDD